MSMLIICIYLWIYFLTFGQKASIFCVTDDTYKTVATHLKWVHLKKLGKEIFGAISSFFLAEVCSHQTKEGEENNPMTMRQCTDDNKGTDLLRP